MNRRDRKVTTPERDPRHRTHRQSLSASDRPSNRLRWESVQSKRNETPLMLATIHWLEILSPIAAFILGLPLALAIVSVATVAIRSLGEWVTTLGQRVEG